MWRTLRAAIIGLLLVLAACAGDDDGDAATTTTAPDDADDPTEVADETTSTTEPGVEAFEAVAIAAGDQHACAIDAEGAAWCWGYNEQGQLGDGTGETSLSPVEVATDERFVQLTAGRYFTCGLTDEGAVSCWGDRAASSATVRTAGGPPTPTSSHRCRWAPTSCSSRS